MDDAGWKGLGEILTANSRLKIGGASEAKTV
jgi:hypothetical protein